MIELDPNFLKGSYTPILTPFRNGKVDPETYVSLIERQIKAGGHGVLVNGTTAEPSTLTVEERNLLVDAAVAGAAGRIPVVAATGSQSHAETIALTEHAERAGADALLIVTPYYIRPSQRGLAAYFEDLAARTSLPVMLYHIPGRAAVSVTVDTLARISERAPNFVGMKHAVNDLALVTEALTRLGPDFRVFVGLEDLSFPMLAVGAAGLMNAVGNVAPDRIVRLYNAVASGDWDEARALHYSLFELNQAVFWDMNPQPIKYMAKRLSLIPANDHRLPMMSVDESLAQRLDDLLRRQGMLDAAGMGAT